MVGFLRPRGLLESARHCLRGCSSVDRVSASEAEGRGFDPRQPRQAISNRVERAMGIEPTLSAWEAEVLPLNYARAQRRL